MTVLEIVNAIETELRLPQSTDVISGHGALLLGYINRVQRNLMCDGAVWDELKVYGDIDTVDGTATGTLSVIRSAGPPVIYEEIEVIRNLQIAGYDPLVKRNDEQWKDLRTIYGVNEGQPLYYRIRSKASGIITVEFLPIPDDAYQIDYELLKKPPMLTARTDTPLLDADTIILGGIFLAKMNQGDDYTTAQEEFTKKLADIIVTQGDSNWGDMEAE